MYDLSLQAKGKLGRILNVHPDGDMKVLIDSKSQAVILSPACCNPVTDPNETRKAPDMPDSDDEMDEDDDDDDDDDNGISYKPTKLGT